MPSAADLCTRELTTPSVWRIVFCRPSQTDPRQQQRKRKGQSSDEEYFSNREDDQIELFFFFLGVSLQDDTK